MKLELLEDALNYIRVNYYGLFHGDADCLEVHCIRDFGTDCFIAIKDTSVGSLKVFNLNKVIGELEQKRKENN